jgi:hypothetical protein
MRYREFLTERDTSKNNLDIDNLEFLDKSKDKPDLERRGVLGKLAGAVASGLPRAATAMSGEKSASAKINDAVPQEKNNSAEPDVNDINVKNFSSYKLVTPKNVETLKYYAKDTDWDLGKVTDANVRLFAVLFKGNSKYLIDPLKSYVFNTLGQAVSFNNTVKDKALKAVYKNDPKNPSVYAASDGRLNAIINGFKRAILNLAQHKFGGDDGAMKDLMKVLDNIDVRNFRYAAKDWIENKENNLLFPPINDCDEIMDYIISTEFGSMGHPIYTKMLINRLKISDHTTSAPKGSKIAGQIGGMYTILRLVDLPQ